MRRKRMKKKTIQILIKKNKSKSNKEGLEVKFLVKDKKVRMMILNLKDLLPKK
jgi:hypothetical protein